MNECKISMFGSEDSSHLRKSRLCGLLAHAYTKAMSLCCMAKHLKIVVRCEGR